MMSARGFPRGATADGGLAGTGGGRGTRNVRRISTSLIAFVRDLGVLGANSASGQWRARCCGIAGIYGNDGILESVSYRIQRALSGSNPTLSETTDRLFPIT